MKHQPSLNKAKLLDGKGARKKLSIHTNRSRKVSVIDVDMRLIA